MALLKLFSYTRTAMQGNWRHGLSGTPEYRIWGNIRNRCNNPRNNAYPRYGGRGITLCERWNDFANFYKDMCPRPSPDVEIERINNDAGYSPENCRWATVMEQANNRRSSRKVFYLGKTMTIMQWARETGMNRRTIAARLDKGWPLEKVFEPVATDAPNKKGSRRSL